MGGSPGLQLDDVVSHPDFQAMNLPDKDAFLRENVPEYAQGAPKDRAELLNSIHYGAPSTGHEGEPEDRGPITGGMERAGGYLKSMIPTPRSVAETAISGGIIPAMRAGKEAGEAQWPLIKRAASETGQQILHPIRTFTDPNFQPKAGLHRAEAAFPVVGPMAASLEDKPLGEAIGAGAVDAATIAGPHLLAKGWNAAAPIRNAAAERIAGSRVGVVAKKTLPVSMPEPAMVKEGMVSATAGGEIKNYENKIAEYNKTVQDVLKKSAPAAPEPFEPIVRRATDPLIKLARDSGEEATAKSIEKWRDDYPKQHPKTLPLDELYQRKQELGKTGKTFKGGPTEEVGPKAAKQAVVTEINSTIGQRIPGLRDITQRESGLITAKSMLENKARVSKGSGLLPNPKVFLGLGGGETGFGGVSIRPNLPGETLAKSLAVKALGDRAPLRTPVIPFPMRGPVGLLPAAPRITPPSPDTSFVRGVRGVNELRPSRMLTQGEGRIAAPPTPDTSSVRAIEAKPKTVRDPKTGKMKRIYTSEGKQ